MFDDVDIDKLIHIMSSYSYYGIFFTVMMILLSDIVYSYRWVYLSDNQCKFIPAFESIILSTALNLMLPMKLGEISRIAYLKKMYNMTINNSVSLIIIEKFFELNLLAITSILATMLILDNNYVSNIGYGLLLSSIAFIFLLKSNMLFSIINYIPIRFLQIYIRKIFRFINKGFTYRRLSNTFLITLLIWITYFLTKYIFFIYVAGFDLSINQIFVIFVISVIAFSVPLTPGAIGIYESSLVFILTFYGIDKESALLSAISLRILDVLFTGTFFLWVVLKKNILNINFKILDKKNKQ